MKKLPYLRMGLVNMAVLLLFLVCNFLSGYTADWFNLIGSSVVFYIITLSSVLIVQLGLKRSDGFPVIGVVFGVTFFRMMISVIWLLIMKSREGVISKAIFFEFLVIYILYLVLDVIYMDRVVR